MTTLPRHWATLGKSCRARARSRHAIRMRRKCEDQLKSCFYFKLHNLCLKISLRCEKFSISSVLQVSYNDFIIDYYVDVEERIRTSDKIGILNA